ncbi:MAG: BMP family ABC transporter substrate-binding protein [Defluviitaleaceae bacterium]|nr:BMP family ABC transporter substrate-binding protein [Defluviitaleaceae bacterium]
MKNFLKVTMPLLLAAFVVACAPAANGSDDTGFVLALVTDYGGIDDGSFNQGAWEGLVAYAVANNITHTFIQPAAVSDAAYLEAIELAVNGGAQLVVTPGFLFINAIYQAQDLFPDTMFVLIDAVPSSPDGVPRIEQNVVAINYAEEQAGFLAGYAAVMDGHRNLGFIGGIAVPAVVRFGHGFVLGADHAAMQLGLASGDVTINFHYAMTFSPSPEVQTLAASWYHDGVEIIFAAAGGAGFSVMAAAEAQGGLIIGVDLDQANDSDTVVTSALKGLGASVYYAVSEFFAGSFPGGQNLVLGAAEDGVGLPMGTSRFQTFSQAQYNAIFDQLVSGAIVVDDRSDIPVTALDVSVVNIIEIS